MEISKVDGKLGVKIILSDDGKQIFIAGLYNGTTGKSKKGNMNMSWHPVALFRAAVAEFFKANGLDNDGEVPF